MTPLAAMKSSIFSILVALGLLAAGSATATTVSSDPVGFVTVTVPANSDATFALALDRSPALQTVVSSVTGNVVTVSASLTENQYAPTSAERYYLRVKSTVSPTSSIRGMWFDVTANSAGSGNPATSTITLDPASAVAGPNEPLPTIQTMGLAAGDAVIVVPRWTLGTLLINGGGVIPSPDPNSPQGTVRTFNGTASGVNLAPEGTFLYHAGELGPSGWYDADNLGGGVKDALPLLPDTFVIFRNPGPTRTITIVGAVPTGTSIATPVGTFVAGQTQDNLLINPFPVEISLAEAGLSPGPVTGSADIFNPTDIVKVFVEGATGVNVPPGKSYAYYSGPTNGGASPNGWYDLDDLGAGLQDNVKVLKPGRGFIVRKAAAPQPSTVNWIAPRPYSLQ